MKNIGIIICARYKDCGGGKCFRSLRERKGGFSRYGHEETVEIVGYSTCVDGVVTPEWLLLENNLTILTSH